MVILFYFILFDCLCFHVCLFVCFSSLKKRIKLSRPRYSKFLFFLRAGSYFEGLDLNRASFFIIIPPFLPPSSYPPSRPPLMWASSNKYGSKGPIRLRGLGCAPEKILQNSRVFGSFSTISVNEFNVSIGLE